MQADGFSRVKLETRILGEELQGKQEWKKKYLFKILLWSGIPLNTISVWSESQKIIFHKKKKGAPWFRINENYGKYQWKKCEKFSCKMQCLKMWKNKLRYPPTWSCTWMLSCWSYHLLPFVGKCVWFIWHGTERVSRYRVNIGTADSAQWYYHIMNIFLWWMLIGKISVYKQMRLLYSSLPTTGTKDALFRQPLRLWLAY